ncbi:AraC family transcriptional regulator [Novosphingobium lindaniclasticum]|uniref:AraC family transcriptional regulator n=1 Tax=Novosphingobium lindaniclasticum TaxID=1329895 RepID=UPI0003FA9781|nr:AraC family transcriptional regulator [Novosphingobium lindaniclasticum]
MNVLADRPAAHYEQRSSETIIADVLRRGPEVDLAAPDGSWRVSRWRQFVGSYELPEMPSAVFVVQLAGKTDVRTWQGNGWSQVSTFPGSATIVPRNRGTRWLVDGELDVMTLSLPNWEGGSGPLLDHAGDMRFAYSDPLSAALARQIVAELYRPASAERDNYIVSLVSVLKLHLIHVPADCGSSAYPVSNFSSYRVHNAIEAIIRSPSAEHRLDDLAQQAGVTPSHFGRMFKKATGQTPHQYVLKARLERAQQMLEMTDAPVNVIAEKLGFNNQSHFNRIFRQFMAKTPTDFRRGRTGALS